MISVSVVVCLFSVCVVCFFFNDTATTEIYTLLTHSFPSRRSSDVVFRPARSRHRAGRRRQLFRRHALAAGAGAFHRTRRLARHPYRRRRLLPGHHAAVAAGAAPPRAGRSEEHTSELQSLMRISYAVFCLTKKNQIRELK